MKIAYCSPFSPLRSGISDFSEELVPELAKLVDIDLFYEEPIQNEELCSKFSCYDIKCLDDEKISSAYDLIVYQMGNSFDCHKGIAEMMLKHPGILELHDISLHHFLAADKFVSNKLDEYKETVRYCHGEKGLRLVEEFLNGQAGAPWETHPLELTVNKHYVDSSLGVIVHSDMAKQMIKAERPGVPIINIPLHVPDLIANTPETKSEAKKALGIPEKCVVLGAFGFATKTKRILETLEALSKYKKRDFRYVVVGKQVDLDLEKEAERLGISDKVIVTGYITLDEYKQYMRACDICVNLRYPTNGESSANLQRILGMGIPAIVTDIGTFSEYPDSCTFKVSYGSNEISDILNAIDKLASDSRAYQQYSKAAAEFISSTARIEMNCRKYADFFRDVKNGTFAETDMADRLLDDALANGFYDEDYLVKLLEEVENQ